MCAMEYVGALGGTYIENDGLSSNLESKISVPSASPPFFVTPSGPSKNYSFINRDLGAVLLSVIPSGTCAEQHVLLTIFHFPLPAVSRLKARNATKEI